MTISALADTVYLKNADRLSGQLLKIGEVKLVLKTAYAGELSISLDKVSSIVTNNAIDLRLKSGRSVKSNLLSDTPGYALLAGKSVAISDIAFEVPVAIQKAESAQADDPLRQQSFHGRAEASVENLQNKTQTRHAEFNVKLT